MKQVLELDSKSAVTLFSGVEVTRDNSQEELDIVELENHVSQAIWKLFDRSRTKAAERLGVPEVDLLLTDARVMGVKMDGNQIINPHGFTGKKLELILGITMVRRDRFQEAAHMFEGGSVRAYLLQKEAGLKEAIYIEVGNRTTTMFFVQPSEITYLNEFEWGIADVLAAVQEEFGVSEFTARGIYNRLAEGNVSERARQVLGKTYFDAFRDFVNGVVMTIKNFTPGRGGGSLPIYLRTFFPVPEGVFQKQFAIDSRRVRFSPVEGDEDITRFVEDEIHETYQELNQLAKRRIRWLMPTDQDDE